MIFSNLLNKTLYRHLRQCSRCGFSFGASYIKCPECNASSLIKDNTHPDITIHIRDEFQFDNQKTKKINQGLTIGLSLADNEEILLVAKCLTLPLTVIKKNGQQSVFNNQRNLCVFNRLILTNQGIHFASLTATGWTLLEKISYTSITKTFKKPKTIYSPFLNTYHQLTIDTLTASYSLVGFSPDKLFQIISFAIKNFKKSHEIGSILNTSSTTKLST